MERGKASSHGRSEYHSSFESFGIKAAGTLLVCMVEEWPIDPICRRVGLKDHSTALFHKSPFFVS